jgi:small subunit ribosomal protein S16
MRLKRVGAKHNPHYRVVITDQQKPRDGRAVEEIGYYDPQTDPITVNIKADRALYWLQIGAVPSETVAHLLKRAGIEKPAKEAAAPDAG